MEAATSQGLVHVDTGSGAVAPGQGVGPGAKGPDPAQRERGSPQTGDGRLGPRAASALLLEASHRRLPLSGSLSH